MESYMIYIFTALYAEAKPLIQRFRLKKNPSEKPFDVFEDAGQTVRLILTGVGAVAACAAVSHICTRYAVGASDLVLNYGSCAGCEKDRGQLCIGNKLIEQRTGRSFYPDMQLAGRDVDRSFAGQLTDAVTFRRGVSAESDGIRERDSAARTADLKCTRNICERTILTGDRPLEEGIEKYVPKYGQVLYDMEAAAIYQTAVYYVQTHQLLFLKVVSDIGRAKNVTAQMLEADETILTMLEQLIIQLRMICAGTQQKRKRIEPEHSVDQICSDLHCSATMEASLRQLIRYGTLEGILWNAIWKRLYQAGRLPCRDRREGKRLLEEVRTEILEQKSLKGDEVPGAVGEQIQEHLSCHEAKEALEESRYTEPEKYAGMCAPVNQKAEYFQHIYVEEAVREHPRTREILSHFSDRQIIEITHYKDVFCRKKQNFVQQHQAPALILAAKQGTKIYPGACVCQNFGNHHFYYTSCVMNCLYDCEYCYLRGMYASGNIVIFVNLEDTLAELEKILQKHSVYLCVSYDTDLMALESITGFVKVWTVFARKHPDLCVEIRTKCGRTDLWRSLPVNENIIYAFTLSPDYVIKRYEHRTASLDSRLQSLRMAQQMGYPIRVCFDPMIWCPDWQSHYQQMWEKVCACVDWEKVQDASVGSFRISKEYMKKMRREAPSSAIVQYPFHNEQGVYQYPDSILTKMEAWMVSHLSTRLPENKIFRWKE